MGIGSQCGVKPRRNLARSNHSQAVTGLRPSISEGSTKIILGRFGQIYEYNTELLAVLVMPDPPEGATGGVSAQRCSNQLDNGNGPATWRVRHAWNQWQQPPRPAFLGR